MNERVLDYGDRAVEAAAAAVSDDVLGLRKRKRPKKRPRGRTVVIVASGFPGYSSDEAEIAAIKEDTWLPHTEDFRATAQGRHWRAASAGEFVGAIQSSPGPIRRVVFIGHGFGGGLGLTGVRSEVELRFTQMLTRDELETYGPVIAQLRPKFTGEASIDLVCCKAAAGETFTNALAAAFDTCVRAFSGPVFWRHPIDKTETRIANRGYTSSDNQSFRKGYSHLRFQATVCPP